MGPGESWAWLRGGVRGCGGRGRGRAAPERGGGADGGVRAFPRCRGPPPRVLARPRSAPGERQPRGCSGTPPALAIRDRSDPAPGPCYPPRPSEPGALQPPAPLRPLPAALRPRPSPFAWFFFLLFLFLSAPTLPPPVGVSGWAVLSATIQEGGQGTPLVTPALVPNLGSGPADAARPWHLRLDAAGTQQGHCGDNYGDTTGTWRGHAAPLPPPHSGTGTGGHGAVRGHRR